MNFNIPKSKWMKSNSNIKPIVGYWINVDSNFDDNHLPKVIFVITKSILLPFEIGVGECLKDYYAVQMLYSINHFNFYSNWATIGERMWREGSYYVYNPDQKPRTRFSIIR